VEEEYISYELRWIRNSGKKGGRNALDSKTQARMGSTDRRLNKVRGRHVCVNKGDQVEDETQDLGN